MNDAVTPLTAEQVAAQEARAAHEPYPERVAVALDKTVAAIADAPPDVTISEVAGADAYTAKGIRGFYGRWMCRFLNLFQSDHGAKATAGGNAEAEQAIEYGNKSGLLQ